MDTQDFIKFQQKHELHRHFVDIDGPYTRTTWKDWAFVVGMYVICTILLAVTFFAIGHVVGRIAL